MTPPRLFIRAAQPITAAGHAELAHRRVIGILGDMTDTRLTHIAANLPADVPFVGPETQERQTGIPFRARLGANESGFGPSPKAIEAMQSAAAEIWKYADAESHDLRAALGAYHGVHADNITMGSGIDGLLGDLVRLVIAPGERVVTSDGAYPTFNYHVTGYGGALCKVPFCGDTEDPQALIAKACEVGAKLIYISNPDNPMGSWHDAPTIQSMIEAVPDGALLILDEAYIEFAPEGTAPPFDVSDQRVIRMRTFSKAYGMAGARVGYAIGSEGIIRSFNKVRNHFGMNRSAQIGALAALEDQPYLAEICEKVANARQRLADIARENNLTALPSATNFVTIDCGRDGSFARAVVRALAARGVFIRMPFTQPQDRCIRVSTGPDDELDIFAEALPDALQEAANTTKRARL